MPTNRPNRAVAADRAARHLFASATARGGSTLLTNLLNAHPEVALGKDPFLPLFRSFRNALVASRVDGDTSWFDPASPLHDYYYDARQRELLDWIESASLDLAVPDGELPRLQAALKARMTITEPALAPHVDALTGPDYRTIVDAGIDLIARVRAKAASPRWRGFEENWPYEFLPALARAYPDARFVLIVRDVRAAIASQATLPDPRLIALPLSFARSWRKLVALGEHYRQSPLFAGRLHVLRYEDLVSDPEREIQGLCRFLEIDPVPEMTAGDLTSTRGLRWQNNSSFAHPGAGIFTDSVTRWRQVLAADSVELIELVAAPDLRLAGYDADVSAPADGWGRAFRRLDADTRNCQGWRADSRNAAIDFGLELVRREWLQHEAPSERAIEDAFLFPEAYDALREASHRSVTYG
jgi:hypothetical protein